mmetsp:Transcript_42381/g.90180  ORF Transcript_42381/g.90180 Transcript_42381/m.90180 type:complete len:437 (-) Transcript_42381:968-2278(-)|eukprot:CAMPEP_0172536212 /NCGR_PEP_ID=MMETSP1067-20121228/8009_1 /TAXON_ID=265564 ORGANISM="Thalassiosira punctigera, Strain Tpunct2005C2" /NCGR_SAMPLE_ID=MMETSP1067 /ASSEMBLY_ACC=CAM_ASM_000444 /LENGTH=436 /DNA_ID=CAMNT_0013321241 /DNA_START=146 /DNA_END=1456 /DNA_ORIENTATION=-
MKLPTASSAILAVTLSLCSPKGSNAFQSCPNNALARRTASHATSLSSTPSADDMRRIMEEESTDPAVLAESAAAMKNMTPEDMAKLIAEMENMPDAQKAQLKEMGMDPDTMLVSMKMMKENPQMMATAQKLMSNMTPEQMLEQSRAAQAKMSSMSKDELEKAAEMAKNQMENLSPEMVDEAIKAMKETSTDATGTKPITEGIVAGSSSDPNVIDSMYKVGELMSKPFTGKVSFQAFATLPPITVLSGEREQDLSKEELAECWSDGSLGAARVDRAGFERVWKEVQEYFEDDIMEEARATIHPKVKKARTSAAAAEVVGSGSPQVGANISEDQMKVVNEQVKNMSDDDMQQMLEGMTNIGPEEEARMKAMGADPAMMRKAAEMMKSNPMMRKAAQMMMKNMSPDQMLKASQQAQSQMANMSKEDLEKAMNQMKQDEK